MFKKKQQDPIQSVSMNEQYSEDYNSDMINQSFGQGQLPPQQPIQPMQYAPVQQIQRPQVNLPPIQPKSQAVIVGVEMSTDGEFIYKVVTNYLLNLGHCQLVN